MQCITNHNVDRTKLVLIHQYLVMKRLYKTQVSEQILSISSRIVFATSTFNMLTLCAPSWLTLVFFYCIVDLLCPHASGCVTSCWKQSDC